MRNSVKLDAIPSTFEFSEYRAYLKTRLNSSNATWGSISKAAKAAGCQRSYLSKVLSEKAHLTPDQAFGLTQWWKLDSLQRSYFLSLVDYERATQSGYRSFLNKKIQRLKKESLNLERSLSGESLPENVFYLRYFSQFHYPLIHLLTAVPSYQTLSALSERLGLSAMMVKKILHELETQKLVKQENLRWVFASGNIHLEKGSALNLANHMTWKQRALQDISFEDPGSMHYSGIQAMSRSTAEKLSQEFKRVIEKADALAGPSPSEEVFCMMVDFFRA